ncbi:MAG: hypothetical protein AAGD05_03445 [Bacteroidota bacterium]
MNVFSSEFLRLLLDGKMVYSTRKGICIFDPENISNEQEPPQAHITAISVNNQPLKKDSSSFSKHFTNCNPEKIL